jgi:hypothetical protein
MGDYLRSLAIRTLSPPAVRPRARSLFEPAKSPFLGAQGNDFPEIEQRIQVRETPAPQIVTSREPSMESKADRDVVRAETHATPVSRRTPTPPELEPPPAPSSFRHADRAKEEAQPPAVGRTVTTAATIRTEILNRPEKETTIVERVIERSDRLEKQTTVHSRETVRLPAEVEHRQSIDLPRQRGAEASRDSAVSIRSSALQTIPAAASNAAAPEIHVSIGRVIVNAGAPPAPRPQAGATTPTIRLSLDQYLRQRGGRP